MSKQTSVAVGVALLVVLFFFAGGTIMSLFGQNSSADTAQFESMEMNQEQDQLIVQDEMVGTGAEATVGSLVSVNYVGTLANGQMFDASANHGGPFQFVLGQGRVIAGWEQGILGMKVGGKRVLVIPPELGYGANQIGTIPANSTLIFQVELVDVQNPQ